MVKVSRRKSIRKTSYTEDDRRLAATCYMMTGNVSRAAQYANIPERTVNEWSRQEWWVPLVAKIRDEKQDELDAKLTDVIDQAVDRVRDRVINGDHVVFANGGKSIKPMGGKDLATTAAILFDKRQLIRNAPTSIGSSGETERLKRLEGRFQGMAAQIEARTINGECAEIPSKPASSANQNVKS